MTQTVRQTAIAVQDDAIASNVAKIETAKRPANALEAMASRLNISSAALKSTLINTVFKGANDDQFAALVIVSNEYKLNPLTKEIYAFPSKGGIVPMVSIDGWIKIMNDHPAYDGIEFNDLPDSTGKLYAIEAVVYRKDRSRPVKVVEYLEECKRNTDPWNKSPAKMLRHRALMLGARYAFGFSGIYSDDDELIDDIHLAGERPVAPLRSAKAIESQETQDEDEETARELDSKFDPHTGVITEDEEPDQPSSVASSDAHQSDPVADSSMNTPAEQDEAAGAADQHPAMRKAGEIKALADKCELAADVTALRIRHKADIAAMPDDIGNALAEYLSARHSELKG
jgi:phage recombination protein Bet